jgi:hypothetical protein
LICFTQLKEEEKEEVGNKSGLSVAIESVTSLVPVY